MNALETIEELLSSRSTEMGPAAMLLALVVSMLTAGLIAALYRIFYEDRSTGSQVHRSFLLIGPAITALFIAIQFSLPLSLGLVGALTIIRFRTPIKEPEEVGFIMLLIASSIVCATLHYLLLVLLLALALLALLAQRYLPRLLRPGRRDGVLLLTLEGETPGEARDRIIKLLESKLRNPRLQSVSFADDLTTIHCSFSGLGWEGMQELRASLGQIAPVRKMNVFFNRQGMIS